MAGLATRAKRGLQNYRFSKPMLSQVIRFASFPHILVPTVLHFHIFFRICIYRYKIYVEGHAWSVSQKYILACDSMSLVIDPHYYDFYTRGLLPTVHYWPISENDKCSSINSAVMWGNKHTKQVPHTAFLVYLVV